MKQWLVLTAGGLAFAAVWLTTPELAWPARALTGILVGPFTVATILQAQLVARFKQEELPPRNGLYLGTIVVLWSLAIIAIAVAIASGFRRDLLGLVPLSTSGLLLWSLFALCGAAAIVLLFRVFGTQEPPILRHLIPRTAREKLLYVGVSITAGVCEELVFRGFLIAALIIVTNSTTWATVLAAAVFGASHAHQGVIGAMRAGLLGLLLSVPLLTTGSVYPGMIAHTLVDVLAGLFVPKWLLKSE